MTLNEYFLRLEAYQIQRVDNQENLALQAWLNQQVQATKGSSKHPKPKYQKFDDFFNVTALENEVHKSFNGDYVPSVESKEEIQQDEQAKLLDRYEELQKIRKNQKKGG